MQNRRQTLLWMKDLIEHMNRCHEQLQWAADEPTESFLTDALLVDLTECRLLCEQLQHRPSRRPAMVAG
jgi:hypothetical protein